MTIWTEKAITMIRKAETKAYTMNHAQLDPLHLLWAFLEGGPQVEQMARTMDLDPDMVAQAAEQELGRMPVEKDFEISSPNESLRRLFLRAVDLGATSPVMRQEGLIGRRELMLALTEDSGRAGALVRNFETVRDPIQG